MGGGDGVHDRQSEAEPVTVGGAVAAGSLERLQQALDFAGGHEWSGVGDGEDGVPGPELSTHRHMATRGVVADRVIDQVADQSFEEAGVTGDRRGVDVGLNLQSGVSSVEVGAEQDAVDDGREVSRLVAVQGSFAACQGEQRLDQSVLMLA